MPDQSTRSSLPHLKQQALQLIQQQRFADARQSLESICAAFPADAECRFMLGAVYGQLGDFAQAERCCKQALASAPQHPGLHYNLAIALLKQDKLDAAVKHFRQAVRFNPQFAEAWHDLGNGLMKQQHRAEAISAYRRAVALRADAAAFHLSLGNALQEDHQPNPAIASYQVALRIQPDFTAAYSELAALLLAQYKFTRTVKLLEPAVQLLSQAHDLHFKLGLAHQHLGDIDRALTCYRRALELDPGHENARTSLASVLALRADYDAAYALLQPVLDSDQQNAATLVTFAHFAHRFGKQDEAIQRLHDYLQQPALMSHTRSNLLFALARLQERQQQFGVAFATYQQANKAMQTKFNRDEFRNVVDSLCNTYSPTAFPTLPRSGLDSRVPIFIVGMPRSGTSLVEQILASHPDVFGAGELDFINCAVAELPVKFKLASRYPACVATMNAAQLEQVAAEYLDELKARAGDHPRVTDKMPNNFMHLGLIHLLFPKSPLIYCTRNPMDTCLSCYCQGFGASHPYSHDLGDLAFYYHQQQRLMTHWRDALGLPMLEIRYEDMVDQQETSTRRLLEYCGLSWEPRCLAFHDSQRTVSTASNDQVRQPMYDSSVGRWKTWAAHLEPLKSALKEYGVTIDG